MRIPGLGGTRLYRAGLRLPEAVQLRIKDVDLEARVLTVRAGNGDRDRPAILSDVLRETVAEAIASSLAQHARDLGGGAGWVELPGAMERKYPGAPRTPPGNGSSLPRAPTCTWRRAKSGAITCTKP